MSKDNSEPAFPAPEASMEHFGTADGYTGASLRDYFAAHAMPGLMGRAWAPLEGSELINEWAKAAYAAADAMLDARSA